MRLKSLMIFAPDLAMARRFYVDVLGLRVTSESDQSLILTLENAELLVFPCAKEGSVGDYANEPRSVFVFDVPDVAREMERLRLEGVRFLHETPVQTDRGRYAAFEDPFGNVHELMDSMSAAELERVRIEPETDPGV